MTQFFNSLSKKKQSFRPLKRGRVSMYNCGPTVYDYVHIGNMRSFLLADLLRRYLEHKGLQVTQIMNITDVGHMLHDADVGEDKIEAAAKKENKTPQEVAAFFTEAFFKDIDRLNVRRAGVYPKASDHVNEMIAIIAKLLANGHAYRVGNDVYFDVSSFPDYGKLSGNTVQGLNPGARIDVREEKKHPADFALWIHNPKHLMQWESPWGPGYPGWHIECSAMSMKYLGETIDIHTGGEDNKFPHHECEIAQSEGSTGQPFSRFWLHVTHLLVDGEKMAKSKGNFYRLDDLVKKGYAPRDVRYLLLSTHYRQQLNFTFHGLDSAKSALARLDAFVDAMNLAKPEETGRRTTLAKKTLGIIDKKFDDDLNVAEALAALFEYVRAMNHKLTGKTLTERDRENAVRLMKEVGDILGFNFGSGSEEVPASVNALIEKRDQARAEKRFAEADRLRDELKNLGWVVEDTADGRRIKRA
ncbi:cysteine--tRNA ligase [Candidatus Uhrbacteria bacterium]|nr:cysteine--tRNA ligase [Candidatus Uhrbacteria bacterium]